MKKSIRFLSLLLSIVMFFGLVPMTAFAATPTGFDYFGKRNTFNSDTFTDVHADDWFYDNVKSAYEYGLMVGKENNLFDPEGDLTIAETLTIAARLHSTYLTGKADFEQSSPWYQVYADYCKVNGIADPAEYDLTVPATRAQFAMILANAMPDEALESINKVADDAIPDVVVDDPCGAAVYKLYRAGILVGNDSKGTFAPDSNIRRCEVAAIVTRMAIPALRKSIQLGEVTAETTEKTTVSKPKSLPIYVPKHNSTPTPAPTPDTYYTVTFVANEEGVENLPKPQTVKAGEYVNIVPDPVRTGYRFICWTNENCSQFDFTERIYSDITLVPQWQVVYDDGDSLFKHSENDLVYDENAHVEFYDNTFHVFVKNKLAKSEQEDIAAIVDGSIVGNIDGAIHYLEILVKHSSFTELNQMMDEVLSNPNVLFANYDTEVTYHEEVDNNPWNNEKNKEKNKGEENSPDGNDWWAEAVHAYSAWEEFSQYTTPIEIGIIDSGFDINHEDLSGKTRMLNGYSNHIEDHHGTHVAGIIGAINNTVGIRGIADFSNLVCIDNTPSTNQSGELMRLTHSGYLKAYSDMLKNHIKIINKSLGVGLPSRTDFLFSDDYKEQRDKYSYDEFCETQKNGAFTQCVDYAALIVAAMSEGYKDFLLVQAAGNDGNNIPDAIREGLCGIDQEIFEHLLNNSKYSNSYSDSQFVQGLSYKDLKNHIVVVGATDNTSTQNGYRIASYSNYGTTVDVFAPGGTELTGIYSTIANNKKKYGELHGTSMAAPIVSGTLGFIWSINPELTSSQVKDILLSSYTDIAGFTGGSVGDPYPFVNVYEAVRKAYNMYKASITTKVAFNFKETLPAGIYAPDYIKAGSVLWDCISYDGTNPNYNKDNLGGGFVVMNADENTTLDSVSTILPYGKFKMTFSAPGYKDKTIEFTVDKNTTAVDVYMVPNANMLVGSVFDKATNAPLADVDIYVYDADGIGPLYTGMTDNSGNYEVAIDETGVYNLKFIKDGYETYEWNGVIVIEALAIDPVYLVNDSGFTGFEGGDGTPQNPYQVSTPAQLNAIRNNLEASYIQINNIDMSEWKDWLPIGTAEKPFVGSFNGQSFSITNLKIKSTTIDDAQYSGFFAITNGASINNILLESLAVELSGNQDILITYTGGIVAHNLKNDIILSNCGVDFSIKHQTNSTDDETVAFAGGLIGKSDSDNTTIQDCSILGEVLLYLGATYGDKSQEGLAYIGGAIGWCNNLKISNFTSSAAVKLSVNQCANSSYIGGIVAKCYEINAEQIIMSGPVNVVTRNEKWLEDTCTYCYAGGVGGSCGEVNIQNAYLTCDITSEGYYAQRNYVGGLFGQCGDSVIAGCQYDGNLSAAGSALVSQVVVGGFIGHLIGSSHFQILDSSSSSSITNRGYEWSYMYSGGMVGRVASSGFSAGSNEIINCNSYCTIFATAYQGARPNSIGSGGVIGMYDSCEKSISISKCTIGGTITTDPLIEGSGAIGGIFGIMREQYNIDSDTTYNTSYPIKG